MHVSFVQNLKADRIITLCRAGLMKLVFNCQEKITKINSMTDFYAVTKLPKGKVHHTIKSKRQLLLKI